MAKHKAMNISKAAVALARSSEGSFAIRPVFWKGSGKGLVAHAGDLFCVFGAEAPSEAAYRLTMTDLGSKWEMVARSFLVEEPSLPQRKPRKPRDPNAPKRAKVERAPGEAGKRGRRPATEIAAAHPGWSSVQNAADDCGVSAEAVRKIIRAGLVEVIKDGGCVLVQTDKVREVIIAAPKRKRGRPAKADAVAAPVEAAAPAAADNDDPFAASEAEAFL